MAGLVAAIARGELADVRDVLSAVTPGGGKSLLPVIAASTLIASGTIDRVIWVVPRDSLVAVRPENEKPQTELLDPPSVVE